MASGVAGQAHDKKHFYDFLQDKDEDLAEIAKEIHLFVHPAEKSPGGIQAFTQPPAGNTGDEIRGWDLQQYRGSSEGGRPEEDNGLELDF